MKNQLLLSLAWLLCSLPLTAQWQHIPSPDGRLHLQADVFFTDEITLEVLDVSGKRVAAKTLFPGQAWDLDLPNLPQGMYVMVLRTSADMVGLKWAVY